MPTIADQPITRGEIREFEQGDLFGDVSTNSSERIPNGTRVEIVAGTKRWSVAIVRGDITESVGRYQVAGRPEWDTPLRPRGYGKGNGVPRQTVLDDVVREALGTSWKTLVVMPIAENIAGYYERPGTHGNTTITARDILALLELQWYVRQDGKTIFGTRQTGNVSTDKQILVEYRNDAIGYRVVNCEDPGAFVPGLTFENEVIGEVTFALSADDIKIHVWSRAASSTLSDWLRVVWRRMFPRAELQGVYEYVVAGTVSSNKHDLRSLTSRRLPDVTLAPFWTGAAGHLASFAVGTRVGLSFMDANPAKPVIVCVEPMVSTEVSLLHAPLTSSFTATNTMSVTAGTSVAVNGGAVNLGDAVNKVMIADPSLAAWIGKVQTVVFAADPTLVLPTGYISSKVKA